MYTLQKTVLQESFRFKIKSISSCVNLIESSLLGVYLLGLSTWWSQVRGWQVFFVQGSLKVHSFFLGRGNELDTSGTELDTSGTELDTSGTELDTSGTELDTSGTELDTSGMVRWISPKSSCVNLIQFGLVIRRLMTHGNFEGNASPLEMRLY